MFIVADLVSLTLILPIYFVLKNVAYCMYVNALQNNFTMVANIMNPDQTAPKVQGYTVESQ